MTRLPGAALAGPLGIARRAPATAALLLFLVLLLTALTQVGGLALWFCVPALLFVSRRIGPGRLFLKATAFVGTFSAAYLAATVLAVPLAGFFGRAPLDCGVVGKPAPGPRTLATCLLNRHYVTLPVQQALRSINNEIAAKSGGSRIFYLDAGFPFFDWFPMLPHISHADGRKVDLALSYLGRDDSPSPIGYWGFVQPRPGDPQPCDNHAGWLRWDLDWLQPALPRGTLDETGTREVLLQLAASPHVRRIFIEPHLRRRLGVDHAKIRFQGCGAARHDDHIHVEFN